MREWSIAFVKAPLCPMCKQSMARHDSLHWICTNKDCAQGTVPAADFGVYPFSKLGCNSDE
jgi:hydrogenase maturation factor